MERGNASVRGWYTRTGLPKFASYSMSNKLRLPSHRYQIPLFELPLTIKVQKAGFQIREDGALLVERGNASVRG